MYEQTHSFACDPFAQYGDVDWRNAMCLVNKR